jgi:hypothetical protein
VEYIVTSYKPKRPGVRKASKGATMGKVGTGKVRSPRSLHTPKMADILKKIL